MGMGFAPTWLRQVSPPPPPPASQNHFNHCLYMLARQNEKKPDRDDLKLDTVVVRCRSLFGFGFGFKRSRVEVRNDDPGDHSNFLHPLHICGTDADTKLKFCAQML